METTDLPETFDEAEKHAEERKAQEAQMLHQQQMMIAQYNDMSMPDPLYATLFSAAVQNNEMARVVFGDQVHPAVRPRFYGAFVTPIEALRGFHDMLGKIINQYDEQKRIENDQRVQQIHDALAEGGRKPN